MPERCDHGENLTRTLRIDLIAKALILRMHKVLTNDSSFIPYNMPVYPGALRLADNSFRTLFFPSQSAVSGPRTKKAGAIDRPRSRGNFLIYISPYGNIVAWLWSNQPTV